MCLCVTSTTVAEQDVQHSYHRSPPMENNLWLVHTYVMFVKYLPQININVIFSFFQVDVLDILFIKIM
jgi:hypothetical protein